MTKLTMIFVLKCSPLTFDDEVGGAIDVSDNDLDLSLLLLEAVLNCQSMGQFLVFYNVLLFVWFDLLAADEPFGF